MLFINTDANLLSLWKAGSIVGICLIAIGIGAGYVDIATHFNFQFLSDHFDIFLFAILAGTLSAFICLIGWARHLKRLARARLAGIVFAAPWLAGLLGYPIAGNNIHGPAALVMLLIVPASILALTLLIMAGY